jgi:hypothetical protein
MTFFASNFIILISGALMVGFAYRMISAYRGQRIPIPDSEPDKTEK